jgi:hypothetical protein
VRGIALFAFHFPEHTRPHVRILRMFTQFGPAVLIACILALGLAWIAAIEEVRAAITASPGRIAHLSIALSGCIISTSLSAWWRRPRPDEFRPLRPQCQR